MKKINELPKIGNLFVEGFHGETNNSGALLGWRAIPEEAVGDGYYSMEKVITIEERTPRGPTMTVEQRREEKDREDRKTMIDNSVVIIGGLMLSIGLLARMPIIAIHGLLILVGIFVCIGIRIIVRNKEREQWQSATNTTLTLLENQLPLTSEEVDKALALQVKLPKKQVQAVLKLAQRLREKVEKRLTVAQLKK